MKQSARSEKFKNEIENRLNKIPMTIHEIYGAIKEKYPDDCDDTEPCIHKGHFYQDGEWKHEVRNAMQGLKKDKLVEYDDKYRVWSHR